MTAILRRNPFFTTDVHRQFSWYWDEAGADVAWRFEGAVEQTLIVVAQHPDLGRLRHFRNPRLRNLRSIPIERPFNKLLIFYRVSGDVLHAVRLMHGARDLPRRLREPPAFDEG
jgi:toxin ParE1/3/4